MAATLHLYVETDPSAGFCFGVINAINKAEEALTAGKPLYSLGELVHNEEENNRLREMGLQTIQHPDLHLLYNQRILFRAHGEPPDSYVAAHNNNNEIIDATCPIVTGLQKQIERSYRSGERIYLYGKATHPEVTGIAGYINNDLVVFNELDELDMDTIARKITLYSQTTQSIDKFQQIVDALLAADVEVNVKNTICRSVAHRKPVLQEFCRQFDKIIFVAGQDSSNGKFLYQVCRDTNPNTYFISKAEEIQSRWFAAEEHVGISGATSTPLWLLAEVKRYLEKL
ncbi:MAG: 4-hydroxy-3-methylbut-2-enyl diphosphate reductase [Prevotellaceae bacterium]|jgi:4-hydroxy-3-methylbut-2-enyl diphosphate reductase|nr:4-hydroxy-3-methylbut-2-enyl diphosphate reductase [Prevotellaceae bacterium]